LRNIILNSTWVKEEITKKNRKYFKLTGNDNTAYQNMEEGKFLIFTTVLEYI
jgi:hypothetical protein